MKKMTFRSLHAAYFLLMGISNASSSQPLQNEEERTHLSGLQRRAIDQAVSVQNLSHSMFLRRYLPYNAARDRAVTSYRLAYMQYKGLGGEQDFKAARTTFEKLKENAYLGEIDQACISYYLARMQFFGLGGEKDFKAARAAYEILKDNPHLGVTDQASLNGYLANMQYFGLGGEQDFYAARAAFEPLKDNTHLTPGVRTLVRFTLAKMQYEGLGGDQDLGAARAAFETLKDNEYLHVNYRSWIADVLARMEGGDPENLDHPTRRKSARLAGKKRTDPFKGSFPLKRKK